MNHSFNTREEYLANVASFSDWLSERAFSFDSSVVLHQWISSGDSRVLPKESGRDWSCSSLFDAYEKYFWRSIDPDTRRRVSDFKSNESSLLCLSERLLSCINGECSESLALTCEKVLEWGGVASKPKIASVLRGHALLAEDRKRTYLKKSKLLLESQMRSGLDGLDSIEIDGEPLQVQIDSGTTKIFSLLVDGFIIYDSRVGAALGMLVSKWASEKGLSSIPTALRFPWSPGYAVNRNPNKHGSDFPRMPRGLARLQTNIVASWLVSDVLERSVSKYPNNGFSLLERSRRPRAIEAALFMIGYAV